MFALAAALSFAVERVVEWLVKPLIELFVAKENEDGETNPVYTAVMRVTVLVFGGATAIMFGIDLITPLLSEFGVSPAWPLAGPLFTAVLVGGGSNLLHDVWSMFAPAD